MSSVVDEALESGQFLVVQDAVIFKNTTVVAYMGEHAERRVINCDLSL